MKATYRRLRRLGNGAFDIVYPFGVLSAFVLALSICVVVLSTGPDSWWRHNWIATLGWAIFGELLPWDNASPIIKLGGSKLPHHCGALLRRSMYRSLIQCHVARFFFVPGTVATATGLMLAVAWAGCVRLLLAQLYRYHGWMSVFLAIQPHSIFFLTKPHAIALVIMRLFVYSVKTATLAIPFNVPSRCHHDMLCTATICRAPQ